MRTTTISLSRDEVKSLIEKEHKLFFVRFKLSAKGFKGITKNKGDKQ